MASRKAPHIKPTRKAFIVTIDDYPGSGNDLPSCVKDGEAIAELLKSPAYKFQDQDIRVCINGEATIKNVTDGLDWLFGKNAHADGTQITSDDRLVFYFSGHGLQAQQEGILRECLCLHDGFLFDAELSTRTQDLPAGVLTIILDCCYSGGLEKQFLVSLSSNGGKAEMSTELVKVKTFIPEREELVKSFMAEAQSMPLKRFCGPVISSLPAGVATSVVPEKSSVMTVEQASKSVEPQINALMIAACQAEETAAASSLHTEGKSAFTFCLLKAFTELGSKLGNHDLLSCSNLFDSVAQELSNLKFRQTPEIFEPSTSPGLKDRSFITLQPISQTPNSEKLISALTTEGALSSPCKSKNFQLSNTTISSPTTNGGSRTMPVTELNNSMSINSTNETQEKILPFLVPALAAAIPSIIGAVRDKDFQPNTVTTTNQLSVTDEKFWTQIISAAVSAVPSIIQVVQGKDFQPSTVTTTTQVPIAEEKILPFLVPALAAAIPSIIGAVRDKDFQPNTVTTTNQLSVTDEKFWTQIISAAVSAVPSIIQVVQGKDFQPSTVTTTTQVPIAEEKILPFLVPALAAAIPSIIGAVNE